MAPAGHIRLVAAEEPAPQPKSTAPKASKTSKPAFAPHVIGTGTPVKADAAGTAVKRSTSGGTP
jgi:hypothetical protein